MFEDVGGEGQKTGRLTDTEVLGSGLEERVLLDLGAFAAEGGGGGLLGSGLGFGGLVIETRRLARLSAARNTAAVAAHSEL